MLHYEWQRPESLSPQARKSPLIKFTASIGSAPPPPPPQVREVNGPHQRLAWGKLDRYLDYLDITLLYTPWAFS